jgi:hypothetical protein
VSVFRKWITPVGAKEDGKGSVKPSNLEGVSFDEPTLGILGMWQMGAGANPHFALALGEIMLRVGQRYIAWTAFERAYRLKDHIWPDPRIQEQFAVHCRSRQHEIEKALPEEDWNAVRSRFDKELAFGENYQKEYQQYEAERLKAGARTDDPDFYDAFEASHDPIATPVGKEDSATSWGKDYFLTEALSLLVAGLLALVAAIVQSKTVLSPSATLRPRSEIASRAEE